MELVDMYNGIKEIIPLGHFILIDYCTFFDSANLGGYTRFAIDNINEIELLKTIIDRLLTADKNAKLYVCVYGNELVDKGGEKFLYGDSIWINTYIDISFVNQLFDKYKMIQPTLVRNLSEAEEINQKPIICFSRSGDVIKITESNNTEKADRVIVLYWD